MHALRHGLRRLAESRAFTLPATGGLALGIAAATAVFSVYSAMLLRLADPGLDRQPLAE